MSVKLGTAVGSYAVTDYRTQTLVRLRGMKVEYHLGVFHANCYNTTLGVSSMTQQSVVRPDFNSNTMIMGDTTIGALLLGEGQACMRQGIYRTKVTCPPPFHTMFQHGSPR